MADTQTRDINIDEPKTITCGLVMPISEIDGCSSKHWQDVKEIIETSLREIAEYNFNVRMVSHSNSVKLIHNNIIQNLFSDDIVVCDVSCKNPNVLFELGMRLAFDKPVVIIKDNDTEYIFDTANIEHVEYPRDLRYTEILKFRESLKKKVKDTYEEKWSYLEHFKNVKPGIINDKEVGYEDYLKHTINELKDVIYYASEAAATNKAHQVNAMYNANDDTNRMITLDFKIEENKELVDIDVIKSLIDEFFEAHHIRFNHNRMIENLNMYVIRYKIVGIINYNMLNVLRNEIKKIGYDVEIYTTF